MYKLILAALVVFLPRLALASVPSLSPPPVPEYRAVVIVSVPVCGYADAARNMYYDNAWTTNQPMMVSFLLGMWSSCSERQVPIPYSVFVLCSRREDSLCSAYPILFYGRVGYAVIKP